MVEEQESGLSQSEAVEVKSPRHWAWGFALHSSTFGVYTLFWIVGLLREIRSVNQPQVRPWVWFFVPLVALAQLFALPRLAGYIRSAEEKVGLEPWGNSRILCILGIIALSLFFKVQNQVATPTWLFLSALLLWGGFFSCIDARFNRVRAALVENAPVQPEPRTVYRWWEWVMLIPAVPFTFLWMPYVSLDSMGFYDVASIPRQSIYQDEQGRYQFPVVSSGWREVSPGTFSDDDNQLELGGPIEDVFAIVYQYDDITVEELAYNRKTTYIDMLSFGHCDESREFVGGGLNLSSQVICEGKEYAMDSLWTSGIFQHDGTTYELVLHMNAPRRSFRNLKPELIRMAEEFAPL